MSIFKFGRTAMCSVITAAILTACVGEEETETPTEPGGPVTETPTPTPPVAPTPTPTPILVPVPGPTSTPILLPTPVPTPILLPTPTPTPTALPEDVHPDIVRIADIPIEDILRNPGGDGWKDSYSVGDQCYCDTTYDHNIGGIEVNTSAGMMTVREACELIGPGPGSRGRPIYNDVQCGNGPANDAGDEDYCPGRTDIGKEGCTHIGPMWQFPETPEVTDPFGPNPESVIVESGIGWVEGPTWVPDEKGFIYNLTDRDEQDSHRLWQPGEDQTFDYFFVDGSNHGAIWSEGLIFLTNREPGRIGYIDPSDDQLTETVIRDGLGRPNDLDRFSDGSLYFSDWPRGNTGVYRLQMNGDMERVISADDVPSPNGIAFTADCSLLYVASSPHVYRFDVAPDGSLSNRVRHLTNIDDQNGIAVDIQGNLYTAAGRDVTVFNEEGDQVAVWDPPGGQRVVNMTFGGTDHRWLLVTSDRGVTAVRTLIPGAECNGLGTVRK